MRRSAVVWAISILVIAHLTAQSVLIEDSNLATVLYKMAIESTTPELVTDTTTTTTTTTTTPATTPATATATTTTSATAATTTSETEQKTPTYPAVPIGPIEPMTPLRALVLGATGQTGRHVVRRLAESADVTSVTAIVRKEAKWDVFEIKDEAVRAKVTQQVVDFEKLDDYEAAFTGPNAVFNCLGSTRAKAGSAAAFRHIDYDYSMHSARLLRRLNTHPIHYTLMTSQGANAKSSLLYPQVKGQTEEDIKALGFARYSIFRPGMLLTSRDESRKAEYVFQKIFTGLDFMIPQKYKGTKTDRVAEAMLVNALRPGTTFELYENHQLRNLEVGREPVPATTATATSAAATTSTSSAPSTSATTTTSSDKPADSVTSH